jgi:hypothetical protein
VAAEAEEEARLQQLARLAEAEGLAPPLVQVRLERAEEGLAQPPVPARAEEGLAQVVGQVLVQPQPVAEVEAVVEEEEAADLAEVAVLRLAPRRQLCLRVAAVLGRTTTPLPPMSVCGTSWAKPSISQSIRFSQVARQPRPA